MKKWRKQNPTAAKAIDARRSSSGKRKDYYLRVTFGITLLERDQMLKSQGDCCATCDSRVPGWTHDWAVDHCHTTNKIRGILCHGCNVALGHVKDNPATLRKMIRYLGGKTNG